MTGISVNLCIISRTDATFLCCGNIIGMIDTVVQILLAIGSPQNSALANQVFLACIDVMSILLIRKKDSFPFSITCEIIANLLQKDPY